MAKKTRMKEIEHAHESMKPEHKKTEHKKSDEVELTLSKTVLAGAVIILLGGLILFLYMNMSTVKKDLVVTVNGESISVEDFQFLYRQLPAAQQAEINKDEFLNITISELLLLQRASKLGITATTQDAEEYITDVLNQAGMPQQTFWERATAGGATKEQVLMLARNRLILTRLLEQEVYPKLNVSIEEAEVFYNASPRLFAQPEMVRASHILVANESLAKDLIGRLNKAKNVSKTFAELAIEYSTDPGSGSRGGDLGDFGRGMMVPPFEEAAFGLAVGKYTKTPVSSQFGYHIIYLTGKTSAMQLSFEESKDRIIRALFAKKSEEAAQDYTEFLRSKATIVVNEEALATLA
ncbi:peptidylprolyl isomerase [Candidatus Woesearchaeota archaeon]|nr:peptidylprolyl isomerase [Candidatus Woesearchaeota archaeon]